MRNLQIPPRCEGCPRLVEPIEHFDSHAEELNDISALSPETIETVRDSIIDVLSYLGLSDAQVNDSIPSVDDTRFDLLRQGVNAEDCMEGVRQNIEGYVDGCPGKLTMRAAGSDGVTYEATLCRSRVGGEQDIEPVAVRRYPR